MILILEQLPDLEYQLFQKIFILKKVFTKWESSFTENWEDEYHFILSWTPNHIFISDADRKCIHKYEEIIPQRRVW